ncbi:MAG: DUF2259 domain-containing protein [Spirochaeta sp.]
MMRRLSGICALLCFVMGTAAAGDLATFTSLGFSDDSTTFAFAQYGVDEDTLFPYADIFVVDIATNRFVPNGNIQEVYEEKITPGYGGEAALYHALRDQNEILQESGIRHTNAGRVIYVLLNGDAPKNQLDFRDFETGNRFQIELVQATRGEGEGVRSRFHINLQVTPESGTRRSHTVGLPDFDRQGVQEYRINQVILSPDEQSLVFVVEVERFAERGADIRYMVETVRL